MEDKVTVDGTTIQRGDVVRLFEGAFGSATVLSFILSSHGEWYAELARPYLYASKYGGNPLIGFEHMAMVPVESILKYYPIIVDNGSWVA